MLCLIYPGNEREDSKKMANPKPRIEIPLNLVNGNWLLTYHILFQEWLLYFNLRSPVGTSFCNSCLLFPIRTYQTRGLVGAHLIRSRESGHAYLYLSLNNLAKLAPIYPFFRSGIFLRGQPLGWLAPGHSFLSLTPFMDVGIESRLQRKAYFFFEYIYLKYQ